MLLLLMAVSSAGLYCFDVSDALGRTVTFAEPPERIVIAGRALLMVADAVYLFPEATEKVAAIEKITQGAANFIPVVDPWYSEKTVLPAGVGAEGIAAVRPDLVLLKSYMRNKLGKPLENLGIRVVYLNFESPAEYLREIAMLGEIMGNTARSREIQRFYRKRLELVDTEVGAIPRAGMPSVLFLSHTQKGGAVSFNVPPGTWLQTALIERAGGKPVWTTAAGQQGWQKVGFEQIAVWDPEYIFVTSYFSNVDEVTQHLEQDRLWSSLRAVKENKLLGFPADFFSWDQPDTRWLLGFLWMAKQFHPDTFKTLSIPTQARLFYREMYGLDSEEYQKGVLPLLRGDLK